MQSVTKPCRHGRFSFFPDDAYVGRSLLLYGEYGECELLAMRKMLCPGNVVVEVGANIGSLTIPMAQMIAPGGKLIAFEPQPLNAALLRANVAANDLAGVVEVIEAAASNHYSLMKIPKLDELGHRNFGAVEVGGGSLDVTCQPIDGLKLDRLTMLKIDAEGHELEVIEGARQTIERFQPILYVENDREDKSRALIAAITDLGYRLYWHRPMLWNPQNFAGHKKNVFGEVVSLNMLGAHNESGIAVSGMEPVADLRFDPQIYQREIVRYEKIVEREPDDLWSRSLLAHLCNLMQDTERARALLDENIAKDSGHLPSIMIRGLYELQQGNWRTGWAAYETRYLQPNTRPFGDRPHDGVKWAGEQTDEPLLLWAEQGFGDSIMFGRFIPQAFARAPNAFVEVPANQYELFELSGLVPPGRLCRIGRTLPRYTKHCSLPSLPWALGVATDDDIRCKPYMRADQKMVDNWRDRDLPKIGFCWQGSPLSERAYTRDLNHELFRPLTARHGGFFSLAHVNQFDGYADTAACIASLDLVITVDTSVGHLAGALGKETWLLISFDCDWRWGLKGERTPWYDSVRIFRQPTVLDWPSVVERVDDALAQRFQEKAA